MQAANDRQTVRVFSVIAARLRALRTAQQPRLPLLSCLHVQGETWPTRHRAEKHVQPKRRAGKARLAPTEMVWILARSSCGPRQDSKIQDDQDGSESARAEAIMIMGTGVGSCTGKTH